MPRCIATLERGLWLRTNRLFEIDHVVEDLEVVIGKRGESERYSPFARTASKIACNGQQDH